EQGFLAGSHFARHLEDALAFGGRFVFEVAFERDPANWQFVEPERVPPDRIVSLRKYQITRYRENRKLRRQIAESNGAALFK
ncbi:MAG TPA: hypothetical protein VJ718_04835, partial [Candidatus Binataceae bacterium]|nr:hypothetical protein [Candidatus Binataceae bacterium]